MKVTLGQINTTPGDFKGNIKQIVAGIKEAAAAEAHVVVFPELAVCGYLVKDMVYQEDFITANYEAIHKIGAVSRQFPKLTIVVGYVSRNTSGRGKPFHNSAEVIRNGISIATYHKRLLCYYDVFDEGRYFEPGTQPCVVEINEKRCSVAICEDIWNSDKGESEWAHNASPIQEYKELGIDTLLVLNSSPYQIGKSVTRRKLLLTLATSLNSNVVYVNQYGGQDELVFDGQSMVATPKEGVIDISGRGETYKTVDYTRQGYTFDGTRRDGGLANPLPYEYVDELVGHFENTEEELYHVLTLGLRDYVHKSGFTDVVIGSSGGIDSALVIALSSAALGPEHTHCIRMPSMHSSDGSLVDASALHENFGCREYTMPIEHEPLVKQLDSLLDIDEDDNPVARENIQARLRGLTVMHMANAKGYLALTTGNKTEIALGYCTINGDTVGGYNPIGDLYKRQVYDMANYINKVFGNKIPQAIIDKAPSAELAPDQTDEASLMPYLYLDAIAESYIEDRISTYDAFVKWLRKHQIKPDITEDRYQEMLRRIDKMEFKRKQAAPIIKVSGQAFGTGRRMPLVSKRNFLVS